jgi:hydrogenase expression/formation protein HypD
MASANRSQSVVFLGVGFETTSPTIAAAMRKAEEDGLTNFHVLCGHKVIPPAMSAIASAEDLKVNGFICPGHVSTIIGSIPYEEIAATYGIPCAITGFEPTDIMEAILALVRQRVEGRAEVEIQYSRVVRPKGNLRAQLLLAEVFKECDTEWRGIGLIPMSGLAIRDGYRGYDAEQTFEVDVEPSRENPACICGEVLRGASNPLDCPLFAKECTPRNPVGACMVSSEGTCAAYYHYGVKR